MTVPKLSIIIITLNEQDRLPRLLSDLAAQTFGDFEVIHVDSNSDDETVSQSRQAASDFDRYKIVEMSQRGVSLGRNVGASHAKSKRLLFLDADTRLPANFLEESLKELAQAHADVGVVCMSAEGLNVLYRIGFGAFNLGIRATSLFFPTAIGACLFSTPEVHRTIGGFDESLSLCEDCNYALKAHRCGMFRTLVPKNKFQFDPRRLRQDGFVATGFLYLRANLHRFFIGELHKKEIPYAFGHYS